MPTGAAFLFPIEDVIVILLSMLSSRRRPLFISDSVVVTLCVVVPPEGVWRFGVPGHVVVLCSSLPMLSFSDVAAYVYVVHLSQDLLCKRASSLPCII